MSAFVLKPEFSTTLILAETIVFRARHIHIIFIPILAVALRL